MGSVLSSGRELKKRLIKEVSMAISLDQLAYLSIALRARLLTAPLLHPHLTKNLRVYGRALAKAKALGLVIPRRVGNGRQELAQKLKCSLRLEGWKDVNFEILSSLLIFDAQLDRNQKRCENGRRYLHVEVHCLALHFASKEGVLTNDPVIQSFLKSGEVSLISESFEEVRTGSEFGLVVQAKEIAPHGFRELIRCLLEINETISGRKPATRREVEEACQVEATRWDQKGDPEAARIRVRGIIHEAKQRQELKLCLAQVVLNTEDRIVQFLMQPNSVSNTESYDEPSDLLSVGRIFDFDSESKNEKTRPSIAARSRATIATVARGIEPLVAQVSICLVFLITLIGSLVVTPPREQWAGIAWWYFELGALIVGVIILISPIFLKDLDSPLEVDFFGLLRMAGIFSLMLLLIEKETPHFGIAWWHASLGGLVGCVASKLAGPYLRSLMTKEDLRFTFN